MRMSSCQRHTSSTTIMSVADLPDEILLRIYSYLDFEDNVLWRRLFYSVFEEVEDILSTIDIFEKLAELTSWKFSLSCYKTLLKKEIQPSFWNDVNMFLEIQETVVQCDCNSINGLFFNLLKIKLEKGGIVITKFDLNELYKSLLAICSQFRSELVINKLRQIATLSKYVPLATHYMSTPLLMNLCRGCIPLPLNKPLMWPPINVDCLEVSWECSFIIPLQMRVTELLNCWMNIVTTADLQCKNVLTKFLDLVTAEIWMCDELILKEISEAVVRKSSIQPLPLYLTDLLFSQKSHMNNIILDRTTPKEAAERLSSLSSEMYQSVPDLDVVNYLAIPNASPISVLTFILKLFSENLGGTLTSFCFSDTTAKQHKVKVTERFISVCNFLRQKNDFLSLKVLMSAIRACFAQPQKSTLYWKDIDFERSKMFKSNEDFIDHILGYSTYLDHVRILKAPYIPYFPAHRQHCMYQLLPSFQRRAPSVDFFNVFPSHTEHCSVHGSLAKCHSRKPSVQSKAEVSLWLRNSFSVMVIGSDIIQLRPK